MRWLGALAFAACGGTVVVGDTAGAAGGSAAECANPAPIAQAQGNPSGFVRCGDGVVHRPARATCAAPVAPGDCKASGGACSKDADCGAKPYGACLHGSPFDKGCVCHYGCAGDADCGSGMICACAGVFGTRATCVAAECGTSADCGAGFCALDVFHDPCGGAIAHLACLGPGAKCRVNADCAGQIAECPNGPKPMQCRYQLGSWRCGEPDNCAPCG